MFDKINKPTKNHSDDKFVLECQIHNKQIAKFPEISAL